MACLLLPTITPKANAADRIEIMREFPDGTDRRQTWPVLTQWQCDPGYGSDRCTFKLLSEGAITSKINETRQQLETQLVDGLTKLDKEIYASNAVEQTKAQLEQKITDLEAKITSLERRITELASKLPSEGK